MFLQFLCIQCNSKVIMVLSTFNLKLKFTLHFLSAVYLMNYLSVSIHIDLTLQDAFVIQKMAISLGFDGENVILALN